MIEVKYQTMSNTKIDRPHRNITKVLNSLFWHFKQQPVPNYAEIGRQRSRSTTGRFSNGQRVGPRTAKSVVDVQKPNPAPIGRGHSVPRHRHDTLESINEE